MKSSYISNSKPCNGQTATTLELTLSNFLNEFLVGNNDEIISLKKFAGCIENVDFYTKVPKKIYSIFQKIKKSIALEKNDIETLEKELKMIHSLDFHDAIVCALSILKNQIYHRYKQKINNAHEEIENHYFKENKLIGLKAFENDNNENYNDIINLHLINTFNYKDRNNKSKLFHLEEEVKKDQNFNIRFWIRQLILLEKIPANGFNHLELEPEINELEKLLNSKNHLKTNKKIFFIFEKKCSNRKEYGNTFIATNGEKISYATKTRGQWFIASHQANEIIDEKNFPESSKIHTNKQTTRYKDSNQDYWNAFSDYTINLTSKLFHSKSKYKDLETALRFLGKRRQIVAQQLDHGRSDGRTGEYGRPRYGTKCFEMVDEDHMWKEIFPQVEARIASLKNHFKAEKLKNFTRYYYPTASSHYEYFDETFRIEFTSTGESYLFKYPLLKDEKAFKSFLKKLQPLFNHLLDFDGKDLNEFIKNIGRLSYELYRQMPFYLGSSAIVGWLTRSIALYKGIELGPLQENENDLPLDWEAFLTFKREDYANWFLTHAYKEVKFKKDENDPANKIKPSDTTDKITTSETANKIKTNDSADKIKSKQVNHLTLFTNTNNSQSANKKLNPSENSLNDSIYSLTASIRKLSQI